MFLYPVCELTKQKKIPFSAFHPALQKVCFKNKQKNPQVSKTALYDVTKGTIHLDVTDAVPCRKKAGVGVCVAHPAAAQC